MQLSLGRKVVQHAPSQSCLGLESQILPMQRCIQHSLPAQSHQFSQLDIQYSHCRQELKSGWMPTLSPTLTFFTPPPIFLTMPTTSWPGTTGKLEGAP